MLDPYSLDIHLHHKHSELMREAATARLAQLAHAAAWRHTRAVGTRKSGARSGLLSIWQRLLAQAALALPTAPRTGYPR